MTKLSTDKRATVLKCLVEGNSIASTTRMTGAAKNTILDLLACAGEACSWYQDKEMRDLPTEVLQLDEIWSFVGCKGKVKKTAKNQTHPGDVWTWTALDADYKLIPSWRVGDRTMQTAVTFCADLAQRFNGRIQITSDGHPAYQWAVGSNFTDVDFAQLVKIYGTDEDGWEVCVGARKVPMLGNPREELISTSFIERSNLTIRMQNKRFARKSNGHSKKLENHCHMLAVMFMSYNYCRKHMTLKETPAQAAQLTGDRWTMEDVVEMMDQYEVEKAEAAFEEAFALKYTAPRNTPNSYEPTPKDKLKTPWYLDKDSGGPNPAPEDRKEGIQYED
jgi:IS1 family transposase